ncbi:hypothetical protein [Umezawaea sp. NPDC059074]|uniref:hypothetical protein n=1 Tax=Umezawaea sp. NPDC059074 TaxID=3346716 RepID=UPI0036B66561
MCEQRDANTFQLTFTLSGDVLDVALPAGAGERELAVLDQLVPTIKTVIRKARGVPA